MSPVHNELLHWTTVYQILKIRVYWESQGCENLYDYDGSSIPGMFIILPVESDFPNYRFRHILLMELPLESNSNRLLRSKNKNPLRISRLWEPLLLWWELHFRNVHNPDMSFWWNYFVKVTVHCRLICNIYFASVSGSLILLKGFKSWEEYV